MRLRGDTIIYDLPISPEDALRMVSSPSYSTDTPYSPQEQVPITNAQRGGILPTGYPNRDLFPAPIQSSYSAGFPPSAVSSNTYRRPRGSSSFQSDSPSQMAPNWNQAQRNRYPQVTENAEQTAFSCKTRIH